MVTIAITITLTRGQVFSLTLCHKTLMIGINHVGAKLVGMDRV
jgi:hypothetical protein